MKLYVGNLSFDTTMETIQSLFEQYGTISDCFLPNDRQTGRPRGFAFVTMVREGSEAEMSEANCENGWNYG